MTIRAFCLAIVCAVMTVFVYADSAPAESQTVFVFVNKGVPDNAVSQTEIQNIYLGRKDRWSDNQKIAFTSLTDGLCHESFIRHYVNRTTFQFQNFWKKQIFTGKGQPPRSFGSDAALVDYVSRTTGAIGYSCSPPDTGKVKLLSVK